MSTKNDSTTSYDNVLHLLTASPTIGGGDALVLEKMIKKSRVQELIDSGQHKYAITHRKNGGLITSVIDNHGKRKLVSGRSEDAFYNALYEWYFGDYNGIRMCDLFEEWLAHRRTYNLSPRTIKRYRNAYDSYLRGTILDTTAISQITPQLVADFFNGLIRAKNLSIKQYGNIVVIPNKLFDYAINKGIINVSPMERAKSQINKRSCANKKNYKTSDRIYYRDERIKFMETLQEMMQSDDSCCDYYMVALEWKYGLRIGELCALKWSDIDERAMELHVQRMEIRDEDEHPIIVEHCKRNSPYADRMLPLSQYELDLFNRVRDFNTRHGYSNDSFIFMDSRGLRKCSAVDDCIRKICRRAGLPEKSCHDIRRTVASELFFHGESLESIRDLLGHSSIQTTMDYIIDVRGSRERGARLHDILGENNISFEYNIIPFCATKKNAANT